MNANNIELVTNFENPMAVFEVNGEDVALDLTKNTLHPRDSDGYVLAVESETEFEVGQDWENEATLYIFEDFTISSSNGAIEIIA